MNGAKDWWEWHEQYADPQSAVSRRLRVVRRCIDDWLDDRDGERLRVVSVCAGQGGDLIPVLAARDDADRVEGVLVELDERNAQAAQASIDAAGLARVRIVLGDAGDLGTYAGAAPADLVLAVGVFGNISDADVEQTVGLLPRLCGRGAMVIWTRTRREPDLTPQVRRWFRRAGFAEQYWVTTPDELFGVGGHRFTGEPEDIGGPARLFTFSS